MIKQICLFKNKVAAVLIAHTIRVIIKAASMLSLYDLINGLHFVIHALSMKELYKNINRWITRISDRAYLPCLGIITYPLPLGSLKGCVLFIPGLNFFVSSVILPGHLYTHTGGQCRLWKDCFIFIFTVHAILCNKAWLIVWCFTRLSTNVQLPVLLVNLSGHQSVSRNANPATLSAKEGTHYYHL